MQDIMLPLLLILFFSKQHCLLLSHLAAPPLTFGRRVLEVTKGCFYPSAGALPYPTVVKEREVLFINSQPPQSSVKHPVELPEVSALLQSN